MSTATKERVDAHFRQRERYLKRTYPFAFFSKDAIKPRSWRFGRVRLSSWDAHRKSSLDRNQIVAMPHGALLLVASKGGGSSPVDPTHFRLMLLDRNNRLAKQLTLPPPATGLGQKTPIVGVGEEDRLLLFDGNRGELQRISDQLKLEEKTELKPWDPKKEHGVSIAGHPDGYLLGVMRTITRVKANRSSGVHVVPINAPRTIIESHEQSVVRIYSKTGRLIRERSLVGLKSMRQAAMLPDGRVVASGSLPQKDASELLVQIGAHVKAERPDGVILCPESDGPGQLVVRGTDRFALGPEAIWAVVSDMFDKKIYARLGSSETSESRPASRRDLLIKVPLDGSKQRIWDITDRRLGPFRAASLAKQGDTLYLINEHQNPSWADVIEIDLGRLEGSEKAS